MHSDHDLHIALQKGKYSATAHPIFQFVRYVKLTPCFH